MKPLTYKDLPLDLKVKLNTLFYELTRPPLVPPFGHGARTAVTTGRTQSSKPNLSNSPKSIPPLTPSENPLSTDPRCLIFPAENVIKPIKQYFSDTYDNLTCQYVKQYDDITQEICPRLNLPYYLPEPNLYSSRTLYLSNVIPYKIIKYLNIDLAKQLPTITQKQLETYFLDPLNKKDFELKHLTKAPYYLRNLHASYYHDTFDIYQLTIPVIHISTTADHIIFSAYATEPLNQIKKIYPNQLTLETKVSQPPKTVIEFPENPDNKQQYIHTFLYKNVTDILQKLTEQNPYILYDQPQIAAKNLFDKWIILKTKTVKTTMSTTVIMRKITAHNIPADLPLKKSLTTPHDILWNLIFLANSFIGNPIPPNYQGSYWPTGAMSLGINDPNVKTSTIPLQQIKKYNTHFNLLPLNLIP